jgi:hypothetical protein
VSSEEMRTVGDRRLRRMLVASVGGGGPLVGVAVVQVLVTLGMCGGSARRTLRVILASSLTTLTVCVGVLCAATIVVVVYAVVRHAVPVWAMRVLLVAQPAVALAAWMACGAGFTVFLLPMAMGAYLLREAAGLGVFMRRSACVRKA